MNKRITIKKIMLMLYALLMCLPLISVGFRSLYVTFNENAFESYYGETINQETNELININNLIANEEYTLQIPIQNTVLQGSFKINFNGDVYLNNQLKTGYSYLECFNNSNGNIAYFGLYGTGLTSVYTNLNNESVNLKFNFNSYVLTNNNNLIYDIYYIEYNNYSYLDNAFDYSLNEFIKNNNTGLINFVGLFSDMFLGNQNVENGLYLGFANFMMNYALFISCAYFVFEVLMWFINYCRKWLYAFEEKGGAE